MNTKQLWTALSLNPWTKFFFNGIFSRDTLINIQEKPKLIICNTDPSNQPGEHWVLFFFDEKGVDFYDSLGRDIREYGKEFVNFVQKFSTKVTQCMERTQPENSPLCGEYCLYYAYKKTLDYSMNEIVNSMNSSVVLQFVKQKFCTCEKYDSCFLQKCINC